VRRVVDPRRASLPFKLQGDEIGIHRPRALDVSAVKREVARDRAQPTGHRTAPRVIARGVPPRPHERFLGDVFSGRRVAEDGDCDAVDTALEAAHETRSRFPISRR
jgi:hypothetical protein